MNTYPILTYAAKAVGYEYTGGGYARKYCGNGHYENFPWNPLEQEEDCEMLCEQLKITPIVRYFGVDATDGGVGMAYERFSKHQGDVDATKRYAVARAASYIGKSMK